MKAMNELWETLRNRIAATLPAQKLWAYYETSAPREQTLLAALALFLGVILVALLVILPLHNFNSSAIADYRAQQETLRWMQDNHTAVSGTSEQKQRAPGDSLLTLANQSARNLGIAFKRYEPNANQGLNLWLENVPFNQVVKWLDVLERDYGVVATELIVTRRDTGVVDIRIVLQG